MRKHLYVDNTDLATYGVYISGQGTFGAPEKEFTTYNVPNRNGLVLGANERMENIQVSYPCFIYTNFSTNMLNLRSFLLSRTGYVRIEDDYDTTHYRKGFFEAGIDPEVTQLNDAGSFTLTFNCMPQRWLKSGDTKTTLTKPVGADITNPTKFTAKPLIRINLPSPMAAVSFRISVGTSGQPGYEARTIKILTTISTESVTYVDFDCETMQAYNGNLNLAKYIKVDEAKYTTGWEQIQDIADFPEIKPGTNRVADAQMTRNIPSVEITPRWWEV